MAIQQGRTQHWTKSSYSTGNGACVEIKAPWEHQVAVRDSKDPQGPALRFPSTSWSGFVAGLSEGERSRP
ncbi:DUF397 domain-containing protein [Streptomyces sp. NPDC005438]|uniref:DUF397 domain-containing protein n=1 Tax=Streptomyces sp. NPDC005438 TaxID=3156880 RepID=UPI0033A42312